MNCNTTHYRANSSSVPGDPTRKAPWIDANQTYPTLPFSYATADGSRISGLVTVPKQPRLKPVPLIVICPEAPWQRVRSSLQTEVEALAGMGFAVVQFNGRGVWGLGLKQRQAITAGYDVAQVDDIAQTVTHLGQLFNVNLRRVAVLGRGHGGFVALRCVQTYPDKFRCAVAIDAPVDLADWLESQRWDDDEVGPQLTKAWLGDAARLKAAPLVSAPEKITRPVLLLNYSGPEGEPASREYLQARNLAANISRSGGTAEFGRLHPDYTEGLPAARAEVFDRIEEFLNLNIYDFKVKLDGLKVVQQ